MVELRWLGHAAWQIKFLKATVFVDPYLSQNPSAAMKLTEVKKADYVLVSHNHFDHIGENGDSLPDAFAIAKRTGAKIVGIFELSTAAQKAGLKDAIGMNIGGIADLGAIKVGMTPAFHSGNEAGFIIRGDNVTIYHAGDTGLFSDMRLIGETYKPDIALLPIGGFFTMGPSDAAKAADLVCAKVTIPMHYNTFPPIAQDASKFAKLVKKSKVHVLKPGETFEYK
jgi:L-ascorbate metabolism protein UlaG (beta-lactamase superfamily)